MVGATNVNEKVKVEILRNKKMMTINIIIEELPAEEKIASMGQRTIEKTQVSGITVSDINENVKKTLNIYGGVKVDKLSADQMNNSEMKVNDIITHINNKPIYNSADFSRKIKIIKNNDLANFLVYRNSTPIYLAIKISK